MNLKYIFETFPTRQDCIEYLEAIRWPDRPICPYCGSFKQSNLKNEFRHHCNKCNSSYSVTTGTVFQKSKCDLQKWFYLIGALKDVSFDSSLRATANEIGVTKDTVSFMIDRIKFGFQSQSELMTKIYSDLKNNLDNE